MEKLCEENSVTNYESQRKMEDYPILGIVKHDVVVNVKEILEVKLPFNYGNVYKLNGGYAVELEVLNKLGIHSRPALCIVKSAARYDAEIKMFTVDDKLGVDAKSILSILLSGSSKGAILRFETSGENAVISLDSLVEIFKNKFGEE